MFEKNYFFQLANIQMSPTNLHTNESEETGLYSPPLYLYTIILTRLT